MALAVFQGKSIGSQFGSLGHHAGTFAWLLFGLGPVLALLVSAGGATDLTETLLPSMRRLGLLVNSAVLACAVSASAGVLSVFAARRARRRGKGTLSLVLVWSPLCLVALPPYIHASAWMSVGNIINPQFESLGLPALSVAHWFAAYWVQLMAYLPLAYGFALLGLARTEQPLLDAGRLYAGPWKMFLRVHLPSAMPALAVGFGLTLIFSLSDFSTPALFQVSSYAMEIFVTYSSGASAGSTLFLALPIVALSVAVVVFFLGHLETCTQIPDSAPVASDIRHEDPPSLLVCQRSAVFVFVLQATVPLVSLVLAAGNLPAFLETLAAARADLANSIQTAALSALLAVLLGLLMFQRQGRTSWMMVSMLPLAIPGALTGVGLILLWNHQILPSVYGSEVMLVLASLARFAPIAVFLLYAFHRTIPAGQLEAATLYRGNGPVTWRKIYLPLYWPGLAGIYLLVFALALGELPATLLVAPPGEGVVSIRIFNLLHYGGASGVASLCLAIMLVSMSVIAVLLVVLRANRLRYSKVPRP